MSAALAGRLSGRRLVFVRAGWLLVALLAVGLFLRGLPPLFEEFRSLSMYDAGLRETVLRNLAELGVSAGFYAGYLLALGVGLAAACFAVAALIFIRRSEEPMALFVSLLLVLLGSTFSGAVAEPGETTALQEWLHGALNGLGLLLLVVFFYVFPDGRFVPGWTRWPALAALLGILPVSLLPRIVVLPEDWPAPVYGLALSAWLLAGIVGQAYRYRRVSDAVERQQTKWVVFGFAVALAGYLCVVLMPVVFPALEPGTFADLAGAAAVCGFMLLIPLSLGLAILRYRLFDIDVLINRTLVYGVLTAILVLAYVALVVALQQLFLALAGRESQLAVVASTLAVATMFVPLRHRTQMLIDRHFYREKYDAKKTLEAFSARLREERDLDALNEELVGLARETLQPEHVSLWLREPGGRK